jgi:hypothetical protein
VKDVCDQIRVPLERIDHLFMTENGDQKPERIDYLFDELRAYCANESSLLWLAAETSEIMK